MVHDLNAKESTQGRGMAASRAHFPECLAQGVGDPGGIYSLTLSNRFEVWLVLTQWLVAWSPPAGMGAVCLRWRAGRR